MGVKPFLVASSIQAVLGRCLIRVLCPKCKQHDKEPEKMWLKLCGISENEMKDKQIFKPAAMILHRHRLPRDHLQMMAMERPAPRAGI